MQNLSSDYGLCGLLFAFLHTSKREFEEGLNYMDVFTFHWLEKSCQRKKMKVQIYQSSVA